MHVLVVFSIRNGSEPQAQVLQDLVRCFTGLSKVQVIEGCFLVTSSSQQRLATLITDLVCVEQAHDPQLDVAIFFRNSGTRWIVTDALVNSTLASRIAGRAPEVV